MKAPIFIALIKISASVLALLIAASFKWLKDRNERNSRRAAMNRELKIFPKSKTLLYQDDDFMDKNYPQKIFFWDEIVINAFRPIVILVVLSVFSYDTTWFKFFLAFVVLTYALVEWSVDELKGKTWFRVVLCVIWILTFMIIWNEETVLQTPPIAL